MRHVRCRRKLVRQLVGFEEIAVDTSRSHESRRFIVAVLRTYTGGVTPVNCATAPETRLVREKSTHISR
jgi:hypothetical protein